MHGIDKSTEKWESGQERFKRFSIKRNIIHVAENKSATAAYMAFKNIIESL
jgi:hypothetical protein